MTFKKFVNYYISIPLIIIIASVSINYYLNEFGLFGNVQGKEYKVYIDEKTTKYLFSFNYIPSNFNGILVGPSYSNIMMDTKNLKGYKVYNLSMGGAYFSELKFAIDNILTYGNINLFIICLDPYITKDSGTKSSQINPKEYYSTLGSFFMLRYYYNKLYSVFFGNKSVYFDSYWGYNNINYIKSKYTNPTSEINKILKQLNSNSNEKNQLEIDQESYKELSNTLNNIRNKGIRIIAYFYPRPKRIAEHNLFKQNYKKYRKKIDAILDYQYDIIIDFAKDEYDYIRDNDSSYIDSGHLSKDGAKKILDVLNNSIQSITRREDRKGKLETNLEL